MITILTYIILRAFVANKNYYLEGDELRHLASARNFYKLWNRDFYDTHPPLFSWLLSFIKSERAGVIVSFLCSIGLYIVSAGLYDALGLTNPQKIIALTFLAFNYTLIYYSNRCFRYQLIALLGTGMIYSLVIHSYFTAGILWGLLGLTCAFAGIRGFIIWALLGFNITTVTCFGIIYGSWIYQKYRLYTTHRFYPSGIDGKIEEVNKFTWRMLLSPLYFPWSYSYYGKGELAYVFPWKIGGVFGLYKPLHYLTPIALFFAIKGALVSPAWVGLLALALLYPALLKRFLARNSIIAIPLLGFLLAKGLPIVPPIWLYLASGAVLSVFLYRNRVFCLTKPKIKARGISAYLDKLPKDGLLVEGLIAYPIAYNTKKRVVVLPHDPDEFDALYHTILSIREFKLNYIVISELWKTEALAYPIMRYIKNMKLLAMAEEDNDTYYVYGIGEDAISTNITK